MGDWFLHPDSIKTCTALAMMWYLAGMGWRSPCTLFIRWTELLVIFKEENFLKGRRSATVHEVKTTLQGHLTALSLRSYRVTSNSGTKGLTSVLGLVKIILMGTMHYGTELHETSIYLFAHVGDRCFKTGASCLLYEHTANFPPTGEFLQH